MLFAFFLPVLVMLTGSADSSSTGVAYNSYYSSTGVNPYNGAYHYNTNYNSYSSTGVSYTYNAYNIYSSTGVAPYNGGGGYYNYNYNYNNYYSSTGTNNNQQFACVSMCAEVAKVCTSKCGTDAACLSTCAASAQACSATCASIPPYNGGGGYYNYNYNYNNHYSSTGASSTGGNGAPKPPSPLPPSPLPGGKLPEDTVSGSGALSVLTSFFLVAVTLLFL